MAALRASDLTKEETLLVGGSKCLIAYPTYTIYHINIIPKIRAILLSFLIMPLKSCPTMAELDYLNTILIVKPVGPDAAISLRSKQNANRLKSFHFEDGTSSVAEYDDTRSRECTGPDTPLRFFSPEFVVELSAKRLEAVAGEDTTSIQQRKSIEKEIESLMEGRRILKT